MKEVFQKSNSEDNTANAIPQYLLSYIHRLTDPADVSFLKPPGCYSDYHETPYPIHRNGDQGSVEVGVFLEHRFAFYYWMKWRNKQCFENNREPRSFRSPHLVSMDWHDDFGRRSDFVEDHLIELNRAKNMGEIALFSWFGLCSLNDGHILPAVWLNAIGDVYLITKQRGQRKKIRSVKDHFGNTHKVHYVKSLSEFSKRWTQSDIECQNRQIYWDIDLDYFTKGEQGDGPVMPEKTIRKIFESGEDGVRIIMRALSGLTFALEPGYSRGLSSALNLYTIWEKIFLKGSISLSDNCGWRSKYKQDEQ